MKQINLMDLFKGYSLADLKEVQTKLLTLSNQVGLNDLQKHQLACVEFLISRF